MTSSICIFSFYLRVLRNSSSQNSASSRVPHEYLMAVTFRRIAVVGTKVFELSSLLIIRSNRLARLNFCNTQSLELSIRYLLSKVISSILCYIFMHCLLILPFICSYMWDLTSKTHIWCVSDFVLKIGYYNFESGISPLCLQIYFGINTSFGTPSGT